MTHHFYFKRGTRAKVLCGAVPQTQPHSLSLLLSHGLAVDMGNLCSPPGFFAGVQQGLGALCSIPSRVIWITLKDFCSTSCLPSGCSTFDVLLLFSTLFPFAAHNYHFAFVYIQLHFPFTTSLGWKNPFCIRPGIFYCFPHTTLLWVTSVHAKITLAAKGAISCKGRDSA